MTRATKRRSEGAGFLFPVHAGARKQHQALNTPPPPGLGVRHLKHSLLDAKTMALQLGPDVHAHGYPCHAARKTQTSTARKRQAPTRARTPAAAHTKHSTGKRQLWGHHMSNLLPEQEARRRRRRRRRRRNPCRRTPLGGEDHLRTLLLLRSRPCRNQSSDHGHPSRRHAHLRRSDPSRGRGHNPLLRHSRRRHRSRRRDLRQ